MTFFASSTKPTAGAPAGRKYYVTSKLTIKEKTTDVNFPLNVKKESNAQVFDGALPIKRLTYNVGEVEWKDTSVLADEIILKFHRACKHFCVNSTALSMIVLLNTFFDLDHQAS